MPPRPADPTIVNVAIRVPKDLHAQARQQAAQEDLTLSQLVRRLVRDYLTQVPVGDQQIPVTTPADDVPKHTPPCDSMPRENP
jgi:hypothetical protein